MIEIKNDRGFVFFKDGELNLLKYDHKNFAFDLTPISDYEELYKTMPITDADIVTVNDYDLEVTGICLLKSLKGMTFYKDTNDAIPAQEALFYALENDLSALVMILYGEE